MSALSVEIQTKPQYKSYYKLNQQSENTSVVCVVNT